MKVPQAKTVADAPKQPGICQCRLCGQPMSQSAWRCATCRTRNPHFVMKKSVAVAIGVLALVLLIVIGRLSDGAGRVTTAAPSSERTDATKASHIEILKTCNSNGLAELSGGARPSDESSDERLDQLGMEKLAEMTAMVRHNEICPDVPNEWAAAETVLLLMTPPTEDQVEAQEQKTLVLLDRIGETKWCQLYSVEMHEAYLIYRTVTNRQ